MGFRKTGKNMKSPLSNMKWVKKLGITLAISISLFLVFSQAAYASTNVGTFDRAAYSYYIDAGTAGLIIQGLIGALAAGLAMGVVFRRRITYWFKSKFKRSGNSGDEDNTEGALPAETKSESSE